jgi:hypothetical protein
MPYGPECGPVWGKRRRPERLRPSYRTDTIGVGRERRASEAEIALAFRGRARHRPVVFPKCELVLMQDELRVGEYSLSRRVDKPRLVIRMHVRHHNRVDVGRRNANGVQVPQETPDVLSFSGESCVHEQKSVAAADYEAVDSEPGRGEAELAEMSALAGGAI